jgi:hypothetical protein
MTDKEWMDKQKWIYVEERWIPTAEFPEHYHASSLGRIRRIFKKHHRIINTSHKHGFARVAFSLEGKSYFRSLGRVIYEAFNGPIPDGFQIDYIDGDKKNNRLDNLDLISRSEIQMLTRMFPNRNKPSKITKRSEKIFNKKMERIAREKGLIE